MTIMTKQIGIRVRRISKAKDKNYIFGTYENILESLFDFNCVSNLSFDKDKESFSIDFEMKVSKSGDMLWILIKEFLSTILETEECVDVEINEREQNGIGVVYKMYRYTPCYSPVR